MAECFEQITTEQMNPQTVNIDQMSTQEVVACINAQDALVHLSVQREIPHIAQAVDLIVAAFRHGGRLFYIGAGTSGRLGVLDASECPPTYGVPPELVTGIIAGGDTALRNAVEGVEDDRQAGRQEISSYGVTGKDVIVGITASGRAPYVLGALEQARSIGCKTVGLSNSENSAIAEFSDVSISVVVGPEVIMGSTRMKSGTAQKMVLNILSTAAMVKTGKVYKNLMVDLQPKNIKLVDRMHRIVMQATGCSRAAAEEALKNSGQDVKASIIMLLTGCEVEEAKQRLLDNEGFVSRSLQQTERQAT